MSTYHIEPNDTLAHEAVHEVRKFPPDSLIAIRGEDYDDREIVFNVTDDSGYWWKYVRAGDWLDAYERSWYEFVLIQHSTRI